LRSPFTGRTCGERLLFRRFDDGRLDLGTTRHNDGDLDLVDGRQSLDRGRSNTCRTHAEQHARMESERNHGRDACASTFRHGLSRKRGANVRCSLPCQRSTARNGLKPGPRARRVCTHAHAIDVMHDGSIVAQGVKTSPWPWFVFAGFATGFSSGFFSSGFFSGFAAGFFSSGFFSSFLSGSFLCA
jgi:hypothetical protein